MTAWYDVLPGPLPPEDGRWRSPEFAEELRGWVAGEVGTVRSLEPVKIRPWAGVWRVETTDGVFFAKQSCALQRFEAALVDRLAAWAPDLVVPVAAVDTARGLLLTVDQGPTHEPDGAPDLAAWADTVRAGARLQRVAATHATELAGLGLATMATADAPAYLAARAGQLATLPTGDPRHLPAEDHERVRARLADVAAWAEAVAAVGLPLTVQHNDLHQHNVFAGSHRFFDFADAVLAEPMGVLLIAGNALADELGAGPDDPRLWRVADAYLEVWSDMVPMRELRAALPAALRLGRLARMESWVRVAASFDEHALREWAPALPAWLRLAGDDAVLTEDGAGPRAR